MTRAHESEDSITPLASDLIARFERGEATVAVVGLGYVGLPICDAMLAAGFGVIGYDIDQSKIDKLGRGEAYLKHLGDDLYARLARADRFTPTSDPARLADADAVLICVPTPLDEHREPDLQFVEKSTAMIAEHLRRGQLVVLGSTSYPGTTREVCLPILERAAGARGLQLGTDWFLAFSPEREDPGRTSHTTRTTPRVVGGIEPNSTVVASALYRRAIERVHEVSSAEVAEASKLLENVYRAVNIALVNELSPVLARMGVDLWEVIAAASTKPFGFSPFYPGPGLGGHCIPVDPFYLSWKAKQLGVNTEFIELAGIVNRRRPGEVIEALERALAERGTPLKDATILVLGLAYKPDVDDVRETPAAEIIADLLKHGSRVKYHDPHVPEFPHMRRHHYPLRSIELAAEALADAEAVVIVTDHAAIDFAFVGAHAKLIIDTRNAMARVGPCAARVVKA